MTKRILCLLFLMLFPLGCAKVVRSFQAQDISAKCAELPYLAEVGNTILLLHGIPDERKLCVATQTNVVGCMTVGDFRRIILDHKKAEP